MQCITRESLQNEKFSLSVPLNKIDIHGTVLLQITIKPSITVLTNSFFYNFAPQQKSKQIYNQNLPSNYMLVLSVLSVPH